MATRTAIHLCSGYGGFELALRPYGYTTVCHVERDAYAAATLVARMEEQRLDQAPIWDDLATFEGKPWCGKVDLITAGLPCQPFSSAGNRAGLEDERHLWPHARRIIAEVRPRLVFLENVPDVVRAGWLAHVLADLATLGFDADWGMLSASAVGAPHRRQRFWLLGYTDSSRRPESAGSVSSGEGTDGWRTESDHIADSGSENVADTASLGRIPGDRSDTPRTHRGTISQASHQWPPGPDDRAGWQKWIATGLPEPSICRSIDGPPEWLADALHLGGNGLVPQCATEAFAQLCDRATVTP